MEKLFVLFGAKRFAQGLTEHPEPGIQALRAALKRSFAVEKRGVNNLQPVAFEQRGVLSEARKIPWIVALRIYHSQPAQRRVRALKQCFNIAMSAEFEW